MARRGMSAGQKIITTLRERRQIEEDLRKMPDSRSEVEFRRRAQRIASLGSQVIPAIVGSLDRADARLLAAMGAVATYLDHDEISLALRQAVLQQGHTDQGRVGAMTILERFLGEEPDEKLLSSLSDPEAVALSSLEEVLAHAESNPAILAEYVQGADRQEPDIVLAVIRTLLDAGDRRTVELLRLMAQDVRDEIAAEALQGLGGLNLAEAAAALQTLIPVVAADLRPLAERALRKLQFSGVPIRPLPSPEPGWAALISPVDGLGRQNVWFMRGSRSAGHVRFLNVLLNDQAGAVEAVGHSHVPAEILPPQRPPGYVHDIALPGGPEIMLMVEASFDVGRRLVLDALVHNRETQIPVAAPLRLLSPWLWDVGGADALPPRRLPRLTAEDGVLIAGSGRLLEHPAFATWTVHSEAVLQAGEEALHQPGWDLEVQAKRLAAELLAEPLALEVLSRRLEAMSEWLLLAGEEDQARLALVAAQSLAGGAPGQAQDHPLLQALARRDLQWAASSLEQSI